MIKEIEKFGRKFVATKTKYFIANNQNPLYIVNKNKIQEEIDKFKEDNDLYNLMKKISITDSEIFRPKQISFENFVHKIYFIKGQSFFDCFEREIGKFSDFDNNIAKAFDSKEDAIKSIKKIMCIM